MGLHFGGVHRSDLNQGLIARISIPLIVVVLLMLEGGLGGGCGLAFLGHWVETTAHRNVDVLAVIVLGLLHFI